MNWVNKLVALFVGLFHRAEKRYYGWKRDPNKDKRDHRYVPSDEALNASPERVDLRSQDGPIFNQGNLGSCVANGWLGLFMFVCNKLFGVQFKGSRLMLYYDTRDLEGTPNEDSGCYVKDGAKVLSKTGVCSESDWAYDISRFKEKPPARCYTAAQEHKALEYMSVSQDIKHMKACLAEGFPFVFGFEVYDSFESAEVTRTGIMPMPQPGESILGGHCVEAIGYVDGSGRAQFFRTSDKLASCWSGFCAGLNRVFRHLTGSRVFTVTPPANTIICRNSWGTGWGDGGYFYMPFDFITNSSYADDFWTVRKVSHGK